MVSGGCNAQRSDHSENRQIRCLGMRFKQPAPLARRHRNLRRGCQASGQHDDGGMDSRRYLRYCSPRSEEQARESAGRVEGRMTDKSTTLAVAFLAEIEQGIKILRKVSPADQDRIDRLVRLTVEVRKYIAKERQA